LDYEGLVLSAVTDPAGRLAALSAAKAAKPQSGSGPLGRRYRQAVVGDLAIKAGGRRLNLAVPPTAAKA